MNSSLSQEEIDWEAQTGLHLKAKRKGYEQVTATGHYKPTKLIKSQQEAIEARRFAQDVALYHTSQFPIIRNKHIQLVNKISPILFEINESAENQSKSKIEEMNHTFSAENMSPIRKNEAFEQNAFKS